MSNFSDVIGGANMSLTSGKFTVSFVNDRFCNPNSAIFFNNSTGLSVPTGVYFSGDFTLNVWIYLKANQPYNVRIIDFGNAGYIDNIQVAIQSMQIYYSSCINSTLSRSIKMNSFLNLNTWYHVTVTLNGTIGSIYVNGSLVATGAAIVPRNVLRYYNLIGYIYPIAIYDDLKIYQEAMSEEQILNDYIVNSKNGTFNPFFSKLKLNI